MDEILHRADILGGEDFVFSLQELTESLRNTQKIFALIEPLGPWVRATIEGGRVVDEELPRLSCNVAISKNIRDIYVNEFCIARPMFMSNKLRMTKRVIAGTDLMDLQAGTIAETPNEYNKHRYLVLLDNGSAIYAIPDYVFPIIGQTSEPWHDSDFHPKDEDSSINDYHKEYCDINRDHFLRYPDKDILDVQVGQKVDLYRDGSTMQGTVLEIDCDVMLLIYKDQRKEFVHRGSLRLPSIIDNLNKRVPPLKPLFVLHDELESIIDLYERATDELMSHGIVVKPTARKSTATKHGNAKEKQYQTIIVRGTQVPDFDCIGADEDDIDHMSDHKCTINCLRQDFKTEIDFDNIVDEFRDVSDLRVPLLLGWKRYLKRGRKNKNCIAYEAPCGKVYVSTVALKWCLYNTRSKLDLDYFSYDKEIRLNREDCTDMRYLYRDPNIAVDSETGLPAERKNVALINIYNTNTIPRYFAYSANVQPYRTLELIKFKIDKNFKSGCDCAADCMDRTNCACHRYNEMCAGSEAYNRGALDPRFNYQNKRLANQVSTGIFECNEFCSCSSKCPNRVVQNGIRARFQIQMTIGKGWGVHTLDDIPEGAFLSTYAGHLLDDADQVGENDIYLADLDFISVNQRAKEVFSDDDEGVDTSLDNFPQVDIERVFEKARLEDENEELGIISNQMKFEEDVKLEPKPDIKIKQDSSALKREKAEVKMQLDTCYYKSQSVIPEPECIDLTMEESEIAPACSIDARYPKRSRKRPEKKDIVAPPTQPTASTISKRPGLKVNDGKYKDMHTILGSRDYTIDSRFIGNLGRFYNHSCTPNAFAQSVFIDTHDLRFPVVAFFASRNIKAMEEITWNYNYKVGSIPDRVLVCNCGSLKCVGRIL